MDMVETRRRVLLSHPHLVNAQGNPISFSTDLEANLDECKVHFEPIQEGTGSPAPDNVRPITGWTGCEVYRTGKNILNPDAYTIGKAINENGVISDNARLKYTDLISVKQNAYTFSGNNTDAYTRTTRIHAYDSGGNWIRQLAYQQASTGSSWSITFTPASDVIYIRISTSIYLTNGQLELGSTTTAYEAYSGTTYPVMFPAVGKNLFDISVMNRTGVTVNGSTFSGTSASMRGNPVVYVPFEVPSGTTLTAKCTAYSDGIDTYGAGFGLLLRYSDGTDERFFYTRNNAVTPTDYEGTITTAKDVVSLFFAYYQAGTTNTWTVSNLQIERGSTATTYELFTNTIYGGYVDYERGEVVATMAYEQMTYSYINGLTEDVYIGYESAHGVWIRNWNYEKAAPRKAGGIEAYCNLYDISMHNTDFFGSQNRTYFENADSVASFKTAVQTAENNGDGLYIAYELATPIHYPITPQVIKSLKGANTIWSDTNGNVSLKYWKH